MDDDIVVKVSLPAWSESPKSWYFLTKRSESGEGWSSGCWLSKVYCELHESKHEKGVGILTIPFWLYDIKTRGGHEFTNLQNKII